jgi:hypothetical protein
MRSVIGGLVVALLAAEPALAGTILYATAASQQRIDGFCLGADGALAATPTQHANTVGVLPRRLLVSNGVLYVAEVDQIQAFRIGAHGELLPHSVTDSVAHLEPKDLALNPDGKTLYVTHQGFLEAFALDAEGRLPPHFTSCVQGENINDFLDAQVANGLLYVSADDSSGRIAIYRLNADGSLPQTGCGRPTKKDRPEVKLPDSLRKKLQRPKAFVVTNDGFIYVEERSLHRITAFRLQPDGTFCDKFRDANGNVVAESCGDPAYFLPTERCARRQAKKQRQQCAASKTADVLQYEDLVLHPSGETLLGTQFFKGRVDAYRLQPETRLPDTPRVRLPKQPTAISEANVVMTPVRLTATDKAVYIAGGELDRVVAFRLRSNGVLADTTPFSRTDEQTDSFPNDVAVAMLSAACQ